MPEKHQLVGIVTNATMAKKVWTKINKKIHLNISFHREFIGEDDFISKIIELQQHFHVHVNMVATPDNLPVVNKIKDCFYGKGIVLHIDPYIDPNFIYSKEQLSQLEKVLGKDRNYNLKRQLDFDDYTRKDCSAGRNYINILPNGDVFTCAGGMEFTHSPRYASIIRDHPLAQYKMGNIFDSDFELNKKNIICSLPCNAACDLDAVRIKRI